MKLTRLAQRTVQHVLVFGEPKTGKSTQVSKLALTKKLIWISNDGGHSVLYKLPRGAQENIEIIVTPDTRELPAAYDTLNKLLSMKPTRVCHSHGVVECSTCKKAAPEEFSTYDFSKLDEDTIVVIDHLSRIADSIMAQLVPLSNLKEYDKDSDKATYGHYNVQGAHMSTLLSKLQVAPFNFVAIAQPIEAEDENGKKKLYPLLGTRNFSATSSQYFDSMIFLEVVNKTHKAGSKTTYSTNAITGSRIDVAVEDMKELSLAPFFDKEKILAANAAKAVKVEAEKQLDKTEAVAVLSTLGSKQPAQKAADQETKPAAGAATGMTAAANTVSAATISTAEVLAVVTATATPVASVAEKPATEIAQSMKDRLAQLKGKK